MHLVLEHAIGVCKHYCLTQSPYNQKLKEQWDVDWKYMHSPMHSAAYIMNPANRGSILQQDPKLWPEFMSIVLKQLGADNGSLAIEQYTM